MQNEKKAKQALAKLRLNEHPSRLSGNEAPLRTYSMMFKYKYGLDKDSKGHFQVRFSLGN